MNDELRELYQEVILDHNKRPLNYGPLADSNHDAKGQNPSCGDHITLHLKVDKGCIADVSFEGEGCAISRASASMMTAAVKGHTLKEAEAIFEQFHDLVTGSRELSEQELDALGKLAVFAGVHDYPARVKCASLAWHTLNAAIAGSEQPVSTE
jgi:nitrogen fixation NifU-like protein